MKFIYLFIYFYKFRFDMILIKKKNSIILNIFLIKTALKIFFIKYFIYKIYLLFKLLLY